MSVLLWLFGVAALSAWVIGGGFWFACLFDYDPHKGHCCDFPRPAWWQWIVGGPLIWLGLALAKAKERSARHYTETRG